MRILPKLGIGLVAGLIVAMTAGCSEAASGATLKSQSSLVGHWTEEVLADVGTRETLSHSTTPIAVFDCGDWSSRYAWTTLTVTVPFYKLQSVARAVIHGQAALGWDTSAAHINLGPTGFLDGGTIRPPHAGFEAGITVAGDPSLASGANSKNTNDATLQITIKSDCFAN
jgi:hypothetical protein